MYERQEIQRYLAERVARPSSAGVILENSRGEALVVKAHYKSYWSFPGGWVEDHQTPRVAAVRELVEETGVVRPEDGVEFACVIARQSDIMLSYQFIFKATDVFSEYDILTLQADEIDASEFVSSQIVLESPERYGLAVVLWARGDERRYVEQQL